MLMRILRTLNLEEIKGDGRNEDHMKLWRRYFNLNLVETHTRFFDQRILTDGCAVSILMNKRTSAACRVPILTEENLQEIRTRESLRFVAVDPGITDVVAITSLSGMRLESITDSESLHELVQTRCTKATSQSYSSSRFYEAAKYKLSARKTNRWNAEKAKVVRSIPSPAVANLGRVEAYARAHLKVVRELLEHRASRGYRNMRFMRYIYRNKAIDAICEMVAPSGIDTVIGFEDWSGLHKCVISRRTCGPLQEIKKRLARSSHVTFLSIDRHRTSKVCCCCHGELCNKKAKAVVFKPQWDEAAGRMATRRVEQKMRIHKVLHCRRSVGGQAAKQTGLLGQTCQGSTWNRDENATRNIMLLTLCLLRGFERPRAFCHQHTKGSAQKTESTRPLSTEPPSASFNECAALIGAERQPGGP